MYLSLFLGFFFFPKFLKYQRLTHIKNLIFKKTHKIKMLRIMVFWSDRKNKIMGNVVFTLNGVI